MADLINKWDVVNRLIKLENEFQQFKPFMGFEHAMYRKLCEVEIAIGKIPSVKVKEEKHGSWAFISENCCVCSVCHKNSIVDYYFCPECGANMDLPRISDQTKAALEKIGQASHGGNNENL